MPQFDAGNVVEGLDYTFRPYVDSSGTITEPSDKQLGDFMSGLKKLMASGKDDIGLGKVSDPSDPQQMMAAIDDLEPDEFVRVMSEFARLHAELCGGHPSQADIMALPLRRRILFFGWLQGEVMSPEPAPGAGKAQVVNLRGAAAG